ncbi:glycosyl transferase [Arthrobacter sp. StoSoilB13]|nr:glycosyl transferase [Arthrobacter sp. StoSoilB13]
MTTADRQKIRSVAVVMPAHNEERHIGSALAALQTAADALQREHPGIGVSIAVVLDACTDRSSSITAAYTSADLRFLPVEVGFRSTGDSRDAGIRAALERLPFAAGAGAGTWLATTDADSTVPGHWLVRQVELANAGADAILGSVEPDSRDMDEAVLERWRELHPSREDHPHIYGANLGVRASAYLAAGGFPRLRSHEDRALVERLRRLGLAVIATDTTKVTTSGRLHARAPEGFAAYLRALGSGLSSVAR